MATYSSGTPGKGAYYIADLDSLPLVSLGDNDSPVTEGTLPTLISTSELSKLVFAPSSSAYSFKVSSVKVGDTALVSDDDDLYLATEGTSTIAVYDLKRIVDLYVATYASIAITITSEDISDFTWTWSPFVVRCDVDLGIDFTSFTSSYFLTLLTSKRTAWGFKEFVSAAASSGLDAVTVSWNDGKSSKTIQSAITPSSGSGFTFSTVDVSPAAIFDSQDACPGRYVVKCGSREMLFEVISPQAEPAPRLVFTNSFGVYETLYCLGTHKVSDDYDRTAVILQGLRYYNALIEETKKFTANTGWLAQGMAEWAMEITRSKDIRLFSLAEDGTMVYGKPVVVTSSKFELSNNDDDFPSLEFDYRYEQHNHNVFEPGRKGRVFDSTFDNAFE